MAQWKKDVLYGAVISIVSGAFIVNTLGMDDSLMEHTAAKAGVYTRFWLFLLLALGILLIIRAVIKHDDTPTESALNPASMITIISLAVYVFALDYLGFIISSMIFLVLLMLYYTMKAGKFRDEDGNRIAKDKFLKTLLWIVIGAAGITGVSYFLFGEIIGLLLPTFNLW